MGCVTTSVAFFSPIYLAYCKTLPQVLYVRQGEGLSAFLTVMLGLSDKMFCTVSTRGEH